MRLVGLVMMIAASGLAAQRTDTIVRTAGRPVHSGVAELTREVAIGVADGDEKYMIGGINGLAVSSNGAMYVLDRTVPTVRVYDAAGKFVKTIGRLGSGPGEYRGGSAIAMATGDKLLVWDQGNARINVYSPAGDVITSWPTRMGSFSSSGPSLLSTDTSGMTYAYVPIIDRSNGTILRSHGWLRFDRDGKLRDTLQGPERPAESILSAGGSGSFMTINVPFSPVYFVAPSPLGYFVTGLPSRMAIDLHEPSGSIASVRRDVTLQPVSARERDSARADVTEKFQRSFPTWSWNGPEIPKTKAAYLSVTVGADGLLWATLSRGPRFDDPTAPARGSQMGAGRGPARGPGASWSCPTEGWVLYDVYEPSGRYLGQVRKPEKTEIIVRRGDYVWAATCNADDAPQVVRYRIAWR